MVRRIAVATFAAMFLFALSSSAFSQDAAKSKMKKDEKQVLKAVSCGPECGFKVRSADEKELTSIIKEHAKVHHNMNASTEDVKKMMKEEKMEMAEDLHKDVHKEMHKEMKKEK